ncbi:AAA family ATPase [Breoghania sp.]|uniref:AAA family ATPase n=1 Tax=Breoghania sp. TaxID=2065378 RepID=UPI002AA8218D|nr:AAA family ATPase [Breoghania sp.]
MAVDLADWKAKKISWADVDRGVLLVGDPGTGKTTFARALANSCGVPLVVGSLGAWQAAGHLGDLLDAMRGCFAKARKQTPCILFIDEIDGFGSRAAVRGDNASYQVQVINSLLECLDGIEGREGVVVVGACNHPEMLDPAIVRAGRLDRVIRIPLPDQRAREQILKVHLGGELIGEDLGLIARLTDGMSGADLAKLVREARRKARRERRALRLPDLSSSLPRIERVTDDVLMGTAVHEAGHALVRRILCGDVIRLIEVKHEIIALPSSGGHLGRVLVGERASQQRGREDVLNDIASTLAGIAAEKLTFGDITIGSGGEPGSDLHLATVQAAALEASHGLGNTLIYRAAARDTELISLMAIDRPLRDVVEGHLQDALRKAEEIISAHRDLHGRLVARLLEAGTLEGDELTQILSAAKPTDGQNQEDASDRCVCL